jgi:hypothetical protein
MNTTDNQLHDMITPTCEEHYHDDDKYGTTRPEDEKPYDGWEGNWAGDGSGMDDFADYNAMEGNDY